MHAIAHAYIFIFSLPLSLWYVLTRVMSIHKILLISKRLLKHLDVCKRK